MNNRSILVSTTAHPALVGYLTGINFILSENSIKYHANSEIKAQITSNIRGKNVYIISTGSTDDKHSVNDHLMEVMILADACKRSSAKSITLIMPCFPYARSDKKDDGRCAIGAALVSNLLTTAGVTRIISVDLHSGQIQGFSSIPFDNLYAIKIFCDFIIQRKMNSEENYILVSPDNGGAKRINEYARRLKMPHAIMSKQRDYTTESKVDKTVLISDQNITGKVAIIIDDIVDTCGTMISACQELKKFGVSEAVIVATHGVLSEPAISRINGCEFIKEVIVTDSLPQEKNKEICAKLTILPLGYLLSAVIEKLEVGGSISKMFE